MFTTFFNLKKQPADDSTNLIPNLEDLGAAELATTLKALMSGDFDIIKQNPRNIINAAKKLLSATDFGIYQTAITVLKHMSVSDASATSILQSEFNRFGLSFQGQYSNITPRHFASVQTKSQHGSSETKLPESTLSP